MVTFSNTFPALRRVQNTRILVYMFLNLFMLLKEKICTHGWPSLVVWRFSRGGQISVAFVVHYSLPYPCVQLDQALLQGMRKAEPEGFLLSF